MKFFIVGVSLVRTSHNCGWNKISYRLTFLLYSNQFFELHDQISIEMNFNEFSFLLKRQSHSHWYWQRDIFKLV